MLASTSLVVSQAILLSVWIIIHFATIPMLSPSTPISTPLLSPNTSLDSPFSAGSTLTTVTPVATSPSTSTPLSMSSLPFTATPSRNAARAAALARIDAVLPHNWRALADSAGRIYYFEYALFSCLFIYRSVQSIIVNFFITFVNFLDN